MKKDIEIISTSYKIPESEKYNIQIAPDELQSIVKNRMIQNISEFIMDNFKTLPIEYSVSKDEVRLEDIHKLKLFVISKEKLDYYREIEHMYNDLCR